jgi:hypothetical protein
VEFDDLKHLQEQQKDGKADRLQTPRDAHLAARAQSLEVSALDATAQGIEVHRGAAQGIEQVGSGHAVEDAAAQAATLHALSGTARALPHAELIEAAFGKHSVADVQAHTDDKAQAGLEAMGARSLAGADRVVLSADADVAESAREAAMALAKQAESEGHIGHTSAEDQQALAEAIGERAAQGRDAEDLVDRITSEQSGRGDQGIGSGDAAGWDGVGLGEVRGAVDQSPEEEVTEGELSAEAIEEAQRAQAEGAQHAQAETARPWFEQLVADVASSSQSQSTFLDSAAFDPPALQARRRKRVGEGWLFDVPPPGTLRADGPSKSESRHKT